MPSAMFATTLVVLLLAASCLCHPLIVEEDKRPNECEDLTGDYDQDIEKLR